ncbi:MAG: hypothetical protein AABY84_01300, partial [Candidatus Firestonebacteria bacterium]
MNQTKFNILIRKKFFYFVVLMVITLFFFLGTRACLFSIKKNNYKISVASYTLDFSANLSKKPIEHYLYKIREYYINFLISFGLLSVLISEFKLKNNKYVSIKMFIIFFTIFYLCIYFFDYRFDTRLPDWFFVFLNKKLPHSYLLIPLFGFIYFLLHFIYHNTEKKKLNIILLIITGILIQYTFGFMEDLSSNGVKMKMIQAGHSLFTRIAVQDDSLKFVFENYEKLINSSTIYNSMFLHTKPPGYVLFYMSAYKLLNYFSHTKLSYENFVSYLSIILTILSSLVLIPIYFLYKILHGSQNKNYYIPLILFFLAPNTALLLMHLDHFLNPLLVAGAVSLYFYGLYINKVFYSFLTGLLIGLFLFVSFSHISMLAFVFILTVCYLSIGLINDKDMMVKQLIKIKAVLLFKNTLFFLCGIGLIAAIFKVFFDYNYFLRYSSAMQFHFKLKVTNWTLIQRLSSVYLNLLEYL